MTILIIAAVAIYLSIVLCAVAYHTSEEYQGNRRLVIILDIFWPVTYPCLLLYVGIVKLIIKLTGYNDPDRLQ